MAVAPRDIAAAANCSVEAHRTRFAPGSRNPSLALDRSRTLFHHYARMRDEDRLIDRMRAIEPTFAGCTGAEPADVPRARLLEIVAELATKDPPVEFQISTRDFWCLRLLLALLRRYGLKPYRYRRQRPTTVMVKISPSFAHEILVPEYRRFSATLQEHFHGVTERVVNEVLGGDSGEVLIVRGEPAQTQATIDD